MNDRLTTSLFATTAGLLLFASDYPLHWWPLHFVALVPLFVGLRATLRLRFVIGYSACFSLSYCVPLVVYAGDAIPVLVAAFLAACEWILLLSILGQLVAKPSAWNAWLSASLICLVELSIWHGFPLFGTAQCFARVTSAAPWIVQFAAYTGMIGVVYALVLSQYWMADILYGLLLEKKAKRTAVDSKVDDAELLGGERLDRELDVRHAAIGLVLLIALISTCNTMRWNRSLGPSLRVAAVSWHGDLQITLRDMCNKALEEKAELIVTPETAFGLRKQFAEQDRDEIANDIANAKLYASIGVFRGDTRTNQSLLIHPTGRVDSVHEKSHLIPWMETYKAGTGEAIQVDWKDLRFGTMICQDDNFTDLARDHCRRGTQIMLVPTNDWEPIRGYHFENSCFRAIENGYAIVRAATGGISAIVSPRGEVLSMVDHTLEPETPAEWLAAASAEVKGGDGIPTVYSRYGDWLIGLFSLVVFLVSCLSKGSVDPVAQSRRIANWRWRKIEAS